MNGCHASSFGEEVDLTRGRNVINTHATGTKARCNYWLDLNLGDLGFIIWIICNVKTQGKSKKVKRLSSLNKQCLIKYETKISNPVRRAWMKSFVELKYTVTRYTLQGIRCYVVKVYISGSFARLFFGNA